MKRIMGRALEGALMLGLGCSHGGYATGGTVAAGKAGSLARFVMHGEHLYALSQASLLTYELPSDAPPRMVSTLRVPGSPETLFPHDDLLFVGTRQGMLVYTIADPTQPVLVGEARHIESCDPVVVQQDVAYVTLRSGSACRQGVDGLFVFDVSNPTSPREVARRRMPSPRGLGVDGDVLFVADAQEGLVVYDVGHPHHPRRIGSVPGVVGYDVIADGGVLYLSADDGLYQFRYDAEGISRAQPLSRIPIGP